ncbi:MAG: hypothetical protein ACP5IE_04750, partial [Infirmifilum sp.]
HLTGGVKIGGLLNEYIWSRSIEKPPRKVKVTVKINVEEGEAVEALVDLHSGEKKD